jgi:hypothetical protein
MLILFHGISLGTPTRSSSHSNQTPNVLATNATEYTFLKQMDDDYPDQPEAVWILVSTADSQLNLILSLIGLPSVDGGGDPAGAEPAVIDAA